MELSWGKALMLWACTIVLSALVPADGAELRTKLIPKEYRLLLVETVSHMCHEQPCTPEMVERARKILDMCGIVEQEPVYFHESLGNPCRYPLMVEEML